MAAASARTSRLGLCGCSMRGKIAVVVAFSAGSIASGSSAGSLVPVASAEGEPLAASAGVAPLVKLVASGGTVAASEVGGVAVPALASALAAAVGAAPRLQVPQWLSRGQSLSRESQAQRPQPPRASPPRARDTRAAYRKRNRFDLHVRWRHVLL